MPIHDWTRVDAGLFHAFHHGWTAELSNALNHGVLPADYFALPEQIIGGPVPDVVTLQRFIKSRSPQSNGGVAVLDEAPTATYVTSGEPDTYADMADQIVIKHRVGEVVAVIEIMSPGNKSSRGRLNSFVEKVYKLLRQGINLLIVDLFPPTPRDPQGIHKAIWDQIQDEPFTLPPDKPLTLAAYSAGIPKKAYVEPIGVGDPLPSHPIFLDPVAWVPAPLEASYRAAWERCPDAMKEVVES